MYLGGMSVSATKGEREPLGPWGLPGQDIDRAVEQSANDLREFRGARVLVTGATGFLGSWILTHLLRSNATLDLGMRIEILSRNPTTLAFHAPGSLDVINGDVRAMPRIGTFDVVIHGATSSVRVGDEDSAKNMVATVVTGTQSMLDAISNRGTKMLFLSSGAVYGPQVSPVNEETLTAPDPMQSDSSYAQCKRLAETLCSEATASGGVDAVVARLFAFVGPRIPLDAHFAAGNFLRDALCGRTIRINGDGRPYRSYLYTGDLPEWCWAMLARGIPGRAYNVGSPEAVSIADLANRAASTASPPVSVQTLGEPNGAPVSWYVPSTDRARTELGLEPRVGLDEALERTFRWYRNQVA